MQHKAPIRSLTLGPAMLGERRNPIDRSTPRQIRQSQHGSDRADVREHIRLSVPAVALAAHRADHAVLDELGLKHMTRVLLPRASSTIPTAAAIETVFVGVVPPLDELFQQCVIFILSFSA